MLGDLERNDEVKNSIQGERFGQIPHDEFLLRDLQKAAVNVISVHPAKVGHSEFVKYRKPRAYPATDINHRPRVEHLHEEGNDLNR